jgi:hypothetical protein
MTIKVNHTFKDHGVRIGLTPDHTFTEIQTFDPPREKDKNGEVIGDPQEGYSRIAIDFTLSKEKATGEVDPFTSKVSITVFIVEDDLGGIDPTDPIKLRDAIHSLRIFNYDESKSNWIELTSSSIRGVFTEPQALFDETEYYGFIRVDTDILSDPPIAVGR